IGEDTQEIRFFQDGCRLVAMHYSGDLAEWDLARSECLGRIPALPQFQRASARWHSIALSSDGRNLARAAIAEPAEVWSLEEAKVVGELPRSRDGRLCHDLSVCFSPDGRVLATGSTAFLPNRESSYDLTLWDARTLRELRHLPGDGSIVAITFSPDGR